MNFSSCKGNVLNYYLYFFVASPAGLAVASLEATYENRSLQSLTVLILDDLSQHRY